MKTKILNFAIIAFLAITTISCSGNDDAAVPVTAAAAGDGFKWTITTNGASNSKTATTANYNLQGNAMNLFVRISNSTVFEINLTNKIPGTYAIGGGNGFYYNFSNTENLTSPATGNVIITSFANNKVSGTFTAAGTGVGVSSIVGTFTNIGL